MRSWSSYIQRHYAILFLIILTFAFSVAPCAAIGATTPTINFPSGFSGSSSTVNLNAGAQLNGSALQLTGATTGMASSAWYVTPVNIQSFTTNFTFQLTNTAAAGSPSPFKIITTASQEDQGVSSDTPVYRTASLSSLTCITMTAKARIRPAFIRTALPPCYLLLI